MKQRIVLDTECYKNYFLVMFRGIDNGVTRYFEMYPGKEFDARRVMHILRNYETVGFNSRNYDIPMLALACSGADNIELKQASDYLILNEEATPWNFERRYNVKLPEINHIDLIEVAPGVMIGLKLYMGRMHSATLQDLPIEPDASISPEDRIGLREYCGNDLTGTAELHNSLLPQLALREQMSEDYGMDLRSKSDAQIAEAVIKSSIEAVQGSILRRPTSVPGTFKYTPPEWLTYDTQQLQEVFNIVTSVDFKVKDNGVVELPAEIKSLKIAIGDSVYKMGIGGLHSTEQKVAHVADDTFVLRDFDVASYYPSVILNERLYPANLGEDFLGVYRGLVKRRLEAKRTGNKAVDGALKVTINGSFGKFGSKWSVLYSPTLLIQVTVTGQLALLMLIEGMEGVGIQVVSANTDGIVLKCPVDKQQLMYDMVKWWEGATGFTTEETQYAALYSRDVNNYVAIKPDGKVKLKGVFAPTGLMKNPVNAVVVDAVIGHLTKGIPVNDTIRACDDVRRFLTVRTVAGGAVQGGEYLGKCVRWYYSTQSPGPVTYKTNGNKAARSDGSKAMMTLTCIPENLDYDWYVSEATALLADIGAKC